MTNKEKAEEIAAMYYNPYFGGFFFPEQIIDEFIWLAGNPDDEYVERAANNPYPSSRPDLSDIPPSEFERIFKEELKALGVK